MKNITIKLGKRRYKVRRNSFIYWLGAFLIMGLIIMGVVLAFGIALPLEPNYIPSVPY